MKRIDPAAWRRVAPMLDEALELPIDEREAFVHGCFAEEPEMQELLRELVRAEARSADLLETPAVEWMRPGTAAEDAARAPESKPSIAGYEIGEEIARGGMGVVYAATRRLEGFEQHVALKIVRGARGGSLLHERFEQERRILARLEHPNIARLVDGGSTEDGRAYFAMEYVDGETITRHADTRCLSVAQRLELFEQVCAAVSFAHQRLVVHRDLKPSNILVDAAGRVRLLDFGIARIVAPDDEDESEALTRDGAHLLTPEYAAPEQVRGHAPSTATDVYSLGVLLFELLSGSHPAGSAPTDALEFALGTRELRWLPTSVDEEGATKRGTTTRALGRELRGDLTAICTKALQRDPLARYSSADALAADLRRHRSGQPVEARVPTWKYRARKYLRRHRLAAAAAALVLLSLGIGLAVSLWQAGVAREESRRAGRAYEFLANLFEEAHPDAAQGEDYTATELLVQGASRLTEEWEDDPQARSELQERIGLILTDRGDYDEGARVFRGALAAAPEKHRNPLRLSLARLELIRNRPVVADSLRLAILESGQTLDDATWSSLLETAASIQFKRGAFASAESLLHQVMDFTRAKFGETSTEYATDLNNLANYESGAGHYDQAESSLTRAAAILDAVSEDPTTDKALVQHNLGDLYKVTSQFDRSVTAFRAAIEIRRHLYPNGHPRLADSLWGLAGAHRGRGELDAADSLLAEALAMRGATSDSRDDAYARQLNEAAIQSYLRSDLETARDRFAQALQIFEKELGPTHAATMTAANNLATVQSMTGHYEEALESFRKIRDRRVETLGGDHSDVAFSDNSIGQVLRRLDRLDEAIASHRRALDSYLRIYGEGHEKVAQTRTYLGSAMRDAGQPEEATPYLRQAMAYHLEYNPPGQRDRVDARIALGLALVDADSFDEASTLLESTLEEMAESESIPPGWESIAKAAWGYARARSSQADDGGRAVLEAARDALRERFGAGDARTERAESYIQRLGQ